MQLGEETKAGCVHRTPIVLSNDAVGLPIPIFEQPVIKERVIVRDGQRGMKRK